MAPALSAAPLLFDMGTDRSEVWSGFTGVTAKSAWGDAQSFGWQSPQGLTAGARAHKEAVPNPRRGTMDPPPMWTNPITEDAVLGTRENTFYMRAAPVEHELYIVCGTSDGALRNQFFDFTVRVGQREQRVQIEGCYQFRTLRFRATVGAEPLAVTFTPRSKWVVNAIIAAPVSEMPSIEKDIITPFEEWTFRLPPAEWAKWKEDPRAPTDTPPPVTAEDRRRGFRVYSRHYLHCVYPHTQPRPEELNPELRLVASPGEFTTTNLIVLPAKSLKNARVSVGSIGPVSANAVEVRRVRYLRARPNYTTMYRYRVVPDVLEHFEGGDLPADENTRFWITLRVPDDAPAGDYRGTVKFACDSGEVTVPVRLRVLPIKLREDPTKLFAIYYRHPYDQMASAPDEVSKEYFRRKAELEHADMAAHGTRNVVLSASSRAADAEGRFNFNWELLAAKLDLWKRHAFTGPVVMGIPTESVYEKYMKERPGSHLRGVKLPPDQFGREMTALVKTIETERVRRGWPEFLYYPVDEPSTDPVAVQFMIKVLQACKAAGVRTYVTADPTHEPFEAMRPYVDVWCTQPFLPEREVVLADSAARTVEYWCYPNHIAGENDHTPVAGARMTYGFGFWRSGFRTLIPWIYQSNSGDPFNYLDAYTMDFFNRSAPDGTPIPVALWEAYREGYNDYRYVYTLEQVVAEAAKSGRPAARQAAERARQELAYVWNAIRVQPKYKDQNLWAPEDFDVYRWIVAQQIMAVQEAMKR